MKISYDEKMDRMTVQNDYLNKELSKVENELKQIKSDERSKEALKKENENLKFSLMECKTKIEEYKR